MVPLLTVEEALILASIRNECRLLLTNDQQEINEENQIHWYRKIYTQQNPKYYWIWLLKETIQNHENIIGYFAARETSNGIYITEGLSKNKRGKGAGTFMLKSMLFLDLFKNKSFYADIFDHNLPSILLHKKFGFKELNKVDSNITRFMLKIY